MLFCFFWISTIFGQQSSDFLGSVSIVIKGGTEASPNYAIVSPSLKGKAVFRGQVEKVLDNNVSFYRVPDLLDPTTLSKPFKAGVFTSQKARAVAVLSDNNYTIERIDVPPNGGGNSYLEAPSVFVRFPTFNPNFTGQLRSASAKAQLTSASVSAIQLTDSGNGYSSIPEIEIEGGPHLIRLVDYESNYTGKFYRITSNSGDQLTLHNPLQESLNNIFLTDSEVEIFEAWTLGELFGYESTALNGIDPQTNSLVHDHIYLLAPTSDQNGTTSDFIGFFHDGTSWKRLDSPSVVANHEIILPNQSFVVARRSQNDLNLVLSGTALSKSTYIGVPEFGKKTILSNPYGVDLMLSDLIDTKFITENNQSAFLWLADQEQEKADNVLLLEDGIWSTYWHDGSNRAVSLNASVTARPGSGAGASMMQRDISFAEGLITAMTNPTYDSSVNVQITSPNHGLREGFTIKVEKARGYKTNDQKQLINEFGEIVDNNSSALIIQSGANGFFSINKVTQDSFSLVGKAGDCNFINDGQAKWVTGGGGTGYEYDCYVSFVGGGGTGAEGIAKVDKVNGVVKSISITDGGSGYIEAPKVIIHSGGWRKVGAGNSPFNDVLIPAGSGIMIVRNHPAAQAISFPVRNPFE